MGYVQALNLPCKDSPLGKSGMNPCNRTRLIANLFLSVEQSKPMYRLPYSYEAIIAHFCPSRNSLNLPIEKPQLLKNQTRPSWQSLFHPTGIDRFRNVFLDQWERFWDIRLTDEVPVKKQGLRPNLIQRMRFHHGPEGGSARWVCSGCYYVAAKYKFLDLNSDFLKSDIKKLFRDFRARPRCIFLNCQGMVHFWNIFRAIYYLPIP